MFLFCNQASNQANQCALKIVSFFVIFASWTSNISGSRQNIKKSGW